ncbi:unnamed protein product [Amoebophrya sp. A120]|nr:unnamed protein product [Amoebophrya sp. A120]|eukprot:GSA120T00012214001.1
MSSSSSSSGGKKVPRRGRQRRSQINKPPEQRCLNCDEVIPDPDACALYRGRPCCVRCWQRIEKLAERNDPALLKLSANLQQTGMFKNHQGGQQHAGPSRYYSSLVVRAPLYLGGTYFLFATVFRNASDAFQLFILRAYLDLSDYWLDKGSWIRFLGIDDFRKWWLDIPPPPSNERIYRELTGEEPPWSPYFNSADGRAVTGEQEEGAGPSSSTTSPDEYSSNSTSIGTQFPPANAIPNLNLGGGGRYPYETNTGPKYYPPGNAPANIFDLLPKMPPPLTPPGMKAEANNDAAGLLNTGDATANAASAKGVVSSFGSYVSGLLSGDITVEDTLSPVLDQVKEFMSGFSGTSRKMMYA